MIRQHPHPFRHTHQLELERVITLAEAAEHYCVHPQTLRYHIQRGRLTARRSGRVWLIHRASLDRLFPQGS